MIQTTSSSNWNLKNNEHGDFLVHCTVQVLGKYYTNYHFDNFLGEQSQFYGCDFIKHGIRQELASWKTIWRL